MMAAQPDDDLVMALVEETLQTPPGEREDRLRKVCQDPTVYREVLERVEWEERMGRFLLDPLFERQSPQDPFQAGNLVDGRFRIVRRVGYGGMGVVYEATDERLERRVALKCARPGYRQRLPPEARAAREVSHYNVCKVHDLHTVDTAAGETNFLSMEFIEGRTLSDRIRLEGPLPDSEAREIATQLCAGLAEAHRQGVVHGDLKCSNILLAASREGRVRAVITDFGMAKLAEPEGGMMSGRGGTFDYMAPELLLGARATIASDLYAMGVMFHVMLTGRSPERVNPLPRSTPSTPWTPSTEATTLTMGDAMVGQSIVPADWQRRVGEFAAPWDRVVNGCLEARPRDRFKSAGEVGTALAPRRSKGRWAAFPAAAALAALGYWAWSAQPTGAPVRLAILPIVAEGETARAAAAGIGADVAERLTGARRHFTVVSPRETQGIQVDSPEKAKRALGATHVLAVRLRPSGQQIVMEASVADLDTGRVIGNVQGSYAAGHIAEITKAILATTTGAFQLRIAPKESVSGAAYAPYVQAIDLLRQDGGTNAGQAIPLFEQAMRLDPQSALPYAGLAEAQIQRFLRHDGAEWLEGAGRNVAKAKAINSDSVRVLLAAGNLDQQHGRYENAIAEFSRVTQLEPANGDGWRRLAQVYESTNRDNEAAATYRRAIEAEPADYRQYMNLGNFYFFRNQFVQAEQQYRKIVELAPWLSLGHMDVGVALIRQGRLAEAEEALSEAAKIRPSSLLWMNLGGLCYLQERYADAAHYFEQSMATGAKSAIQYRDLGDAYRQLGRAGDSAEAYRAGLDLAEEEVARNPRDAMARARMALLAAFLGDKRRAALEVPQALATQPDNPAVMRDAATTYEVLGQREKTLEVLQKAPVQLLQELSRFPDVRELQRDPRFAELLHK